MMRTADLRKMTSQFGKKRLEHTRLVSACWGSVCKTCSKIWSELVQTTRGKQLR